MATVAGGDGSARPCARKGGRGEERTGESERGTGRRVVMSGCSRATRRMPGWQLHAGAHGVGHRFPSAYWQEEEDGYAPGGLGQNRNGPARGARRL